MLAQNEVFVCGFSAPNLSGNVSSHHQFILVAKKNELQVLCRLVSIWDELSCGKFHLINIYFQSFNYQICILDVCDYRLCVYHCSIILCHKTTGQSLACQRIAIKNVLTKSLRPLRRQDTSLFHLPITGSLTI